MPDINLENILTFAAQKEVSDVHFQVGVPPLVRHNGKLIPISKSLHLAWRIRSISLSILSGMGST